MIKRIGAGEFSEQFLQGQGSPAVIEGALEEWEYSRRWTPRYLASLAKERPVTLSVSANGNFYYNSASRMSEAASFERRETRFGEAVQAVLDHQSDVSIYIMCQSISQTLPDLRSHIVVPQWIESSSTGEANEQPAINLWLGRNTKTQLHYDSSNNFFAQLHGTKRFTIFPPSDTPYMYPYPLDAFMRHVSHVDADAPDVDRYPLFSRATAVTFEVGAGDLLFLPAYWWHQVQSTEIAVSVNFWTTPRGTQFLACPNAVRNLYPAYKQDRLAQFDRSHLQPNGLDFIAAAHLLLNANRIWAACLCGLAAFDKLTFKAYRHDRAIGCSLSDLSEDLKAASSSLAFDDSIPPNHRRTLQKVPQLAAITAMCDDSLLSARDIRELLEAVSLLSKMPMLRAT